MIKESASVLTVDTGYLVPHRVSAQLAVQRNGGLLPWELGCCSCESSTFDLRNKIPRRTSSSSCRGSPLREKKQRFSLLFCLVCEHCLDPRVT